MKKEEHKKKGGKKGGKKAEERAEERKPGASAEGNHSSGPREKGKAGETAGGGGGAGRKGAKALLCVLLFGVAFAVPFFSSASFFLKPIDPGSRNFEEFDSSYQIRRVERTLAHYPRVPFHDSYCYFPGDPVTPWPAGYTLFLATVAKPFDLLFHSRLVTETVVGVMPCVLEAAAVLLFLLLFTRYLPFGTAFGAAFLLALSFMNTAYAGAGNIDHHVFITFLTACSACLAAAYERRPAVGRGLALGLFLGLSLLFNVSLIQYVLLFLLAAGAHLLFARGEDAPPAKAAACLFAAALAGSFLAALGTPEGRSLEIRYDVVSLFQFLLILLTGVAVFVAFLWFRPPPRLRRYRVPLSLAAAAGAALLAVATCGDVLEGAKFLLAGNRLNRSQSEEASILAYHAMWPQVFTWWVFLAPFGLLSLVRRLRGRPFFLAMVLLFLAHGALAGLSHLLYVQYLYPWYALAAAAGLVAVAGWLKPHMGRLRWLVILPFAAQAVFTAWSARLAENEFTLNRERTSEQTIRAMMWLRGHSPETSHYADGDGRPEYSVMAHRDFGHRIVRVAHRPVTNSPFSTPDFVDHMKDYVRLAFSPREEQVAAFMDRYAARYLIVDERDARTRDFLLGVIAGDPDYDRYAAAVHSGAFYSLFRNNLLFFDGELRLGGAAPVRRFRLVYEGASKLPLEIGTSSGPKRILYNTFKIFEYVEGARVTGEGYEPGERVSFRLPLQTNTKRRFVYTSFAAAGREGRIFVVLPYATERTGRSAVVPLAPGYRVSGSSGAGTLALPERLVETGGAARIDAASLSR